MAAPKPLDLSGIANEALSRVLRTRGSAPLAILAYLVGTQHGKLLGVLLKVLVALGSEIPG